MTRQLRTLGPMLWSDESGFLVSAELIIIATLLVIGLVVGLAEVQNAVVGELNDVGEAIGSLNQSYYFHGHRSWGGFGGFGFGGGFGFCGGLKASTPGSAFIDRTDAGDRNECSISCFAPTAETLKGGVCSALTTGGVPGGTVIEKAPGHGAIIEGDALHGGSPDCALPPSS